MLVGVQIGRGGRGESAGESLAELKQLAISAGWHIVGELSAKRERPDPALYVGSGKVEELFALAEQVQADAVLFDAALSPGQQRNLERELKRRVLDRTALILEIFALRAKSHEGKLQVELAQLEHLSTRLVRGWTHLERQRGGIGLRGGPGETQLELDRRMIATRVKSLRERLKTLHKQRRTQRRARARRDVFSVSLVGYTNAGKSTLFNALTNAQTYAADQLFATLDTTARRCFVEPGVEVVLSDTVGFIRGLPHTLIEAFKSTLEETVHADLLLHVVDASSPVRDEQMDEVMRVLNDIGAADVPQLLVFNKVDRMGDHVVSGLAERDPCGSIARVFVSALSGRGLDQLRAAIAECRRSKLSAEPSVELNRHDGVSPLDVDALELHQSLPRLHSI